MNRDESRESAAAETSQREAPRFAAELSPYRGRLAPSPTGYLHLGHAQTFYIAAKRAERAGGSLLLRSDDLDRSRYRPEFARAVLDDLQWLGLKWQEPVVVQSERLPSYRKALERLHASGFIFPCSRSRRDVMEAIGAPHEQPAALNDEEPLYPRAFRPPNGEPLPPLGERVSTNWRFRVPEGELIQFNDARMGNQTATAGVDFGDFLVWRKDDLPSYQLACAVDDAELEITEVVRGEDLVRSTFRQILILGALGLNIPRYFHCPLLMDENGVRLAKRHDALSLRTLRDAGKSPAEIISTFSKYLVE